jgi:hypothetical protein
MDTRASSIDRKHASIWRSDCGLAISCIEKIKVLNENIDELIADRAGCS